MENTSQIVLRNQARLKDPLLVIGPPEDALGPLSAVAGTVLTDHAGRARRLAGQSRFPVVFGCDDAELGVQHFSQALIFMPKSRQELAMRLELAAARLQVGGEILVVGGKREGIAGAGKQLAALCGNADKLDSARHCQLWSGIVSEPGRPFDLSRWFDAFEADVGGESLRIRALPGVFSAGRLDAGTQLLLESFSAPPAGPVLDFACGAGIIGTWLARRYGCAVDMADVQAQALLSSRETLAANGLTGTVYAADGLSELPGGYGTIVTNPPFHTGVKIDMGVTERFLRDAAAHLLPGGELRLVANAFLPYASLIEASVGPCEVLAENTRFRVYRARRKPQGARPIGGFTAP